MTEAAVSGGQAAADSQGTTANAPVVANGSGGQAQTTGNGSAATAEESFFDPKSIEHDPNLMKAFRQMQGDYTRKMQSFRSNQQAIDAYNAFQRDPVGTMQTLAGQYGLRVLQNGQNEQIAEQGFQSWDDVEKYFYDKFEKKALQPLTREVQNLKKQNIEQQLDTKFPDWRMYESGMMDVLKAHPTLVNDPDTLYRMAVPANILEARATQAALAKLKGATEHAQVSGGATSRQTTNEPTGPITFAQAAERALKAVKGMKRSA